MISVCFFVLNDCFDRFEYVWVICLGIWGWSVGPFWSTKIIAIGDRLIGFLGACSESIKSGWMD